MLKTNLAAINPALEITWTERTISSRHLIGCLSVLQSLSSRGGFCRYSNSRGTRGRSSWAFTGMEATYSSDGDGQRDCQAWLSYLWLLDLKFGNNKASPRWRRAKVSGEINRRSSWQARGNARKLRDIIRILGYPLNESSRDIAKVFVDNIGRKLVANRSVHKRL